MISEKAEYWIAVGVLALFVGNHFAVRHESDVRSLASRSLAAIEQVSAHATSLMATAEAMLGQGETQFARVQTTLACAQTRVASVQTVIAQHQASLARVQAVRARIIALQQLRAAVVCPRQRLRMAIQ